jgi:hypothetical protein
MAEQFRGENIVEIRKGILEAVEDDQDSLNAGDGGGTSGGGMEARLAKLEAQMEHVQADLAKLASVPVDVAIIKSDMVTKDYLNSAFEKHLRWTLGIVGLMLTVATAINKLWH